MTFFDATNSISESKRIEIRSGRTLHCRKVTVQTLTKSSQIQPESTSVSNILFVHGSCAASSQFDDLIMEIKKLFENQDQTDFDSLNCYLYDQLGCSESKHPVDDWSAFSTEELNLDLQTMISSILNGDNDEDCSDKNTPPLFIVGHSHGCSQIIQAVNTLTSNSKVPTSRIRGVIMMGGILSDEPTLTIKEGGHWIFKFIPMFLLNKMQPSLSEAFFQAAIHPSNQERLRTKALGISNRNDMRFCKAFYRQQKYATSKEASELEVSDQI
jgi:hypothetical protein